MSLSPSISEPTIDPSARFADPIAASPDAEKRESKFWGEDGMRFGDLLDTINPLQHIPVVSSIYRRLTGDDLSPAARLAGDTLFGGPLGFVSGLFNTVVEGATGRDVGGHLLALLPGGAPPDSGASTVVAATTPLETPQTGAAADRLVAPSLGDRAAAITPQTYDGRNAMALAALQRDLLSPATSRAPSARTNTDALSALRRDLSVARRAPAAATGPAPAAPGPSAAATRGPRPNILVAMPPPPTAATEPARADGRKPGEYSAAELASIFRSYQRAAETAASPESTRSTRVED